MPYWSIAEWRARIGSSWCALGRPVKSKSSFRRGTGWVLTLNQVVTMMIILILLIVMNLVLREIGSGECCCIFTNLLQSVQVAVSPTIYFLNLDCLLSSALRNYAPLLYQLFPTIVKQSVKQLCSDLMQTFCFISCILYRLLFLISPLMHPVQWLILFVICRLDWMRAMSNLRKILANDGATYGLVEEVELRNRSESLRWLAVAKSLLDTVVAVAASVVISLLLMSGDVEEDPGPGDLDYNDVDASQILETSDLIDVMEEVESLQSVYYRLGQSLRLNIADLEAIRDTSPDADQALEKVILLWLGKKYNVEKYGQPTWRMLVETVDRKRGGNNHELAKKIASKHPSDVTKSSSELASCVFSPLKSDDTPVSEDLGGTRKMSQQPPVTPERATDKEEEILEIGNMREVLEFFWKFRSKWKLIGIELKIDMSTLDSIDKDNRKSEDCLVELASKWLRRATPQPTRSAMAAVLQSKPLTDEMTTAETCDIKKDYAQYLKSLYKVKTLACSSDDQWPPPVTDKIFRLAMIKTEEQIRMQGGCTEGDLVREKTIVGKVDDILKRKVSIELEDIFKETTHQRKLVLIEGAPGSGKSTLSLHICHQWTEKNLFPEYELVILVKLRELPIQNAKSIAELLPRRDETMGHNIEKAITDIDGRSVLFVLDGWDELPQGVSAYSMILNLIEGTKLHESSIIVTSRTTSSAILHTLVSLRTEILGFTKNQLHLYFMKCLENSRQAVETLLQRIRQDPILEGSCYLPLNASILVHLFKCGGNVLPTTQYGIFTELVCSCIYRHLKKTQKQECNLKSLDELPLEVDCAFQELCKLAYDGIIEDRVVFDLRSDFNTLGLLQGVESFAIRGKSYSFNFVHLSIQELLAAIYMATKLQESTQIEQFNKLFGKLRFAAVFQFFAAKTKLRTSGISDIVKQVAKKCAVDRPESGDKTLLVSLIHCLFEAQDSSLCQLVAGELKQTLNLGGTSLTLADCYCLGYFLTYCKDFDSVKLSSFITDEHFKSIFRQGEVYSFRYLE